MTHAGQDDPPPVPPAPPAAPHYPGQPMPGQLMPGQPMPQAGWVSPGQPPYQAWGPGQSVPGDVAVPSGGKKKLWASIGGGLVGLVVIGAGVFSLVGAGDPEVGDCIRLAADQSVETVDCDSAEAEFKVIGVQDGTQNEQEYREDQATCADFPGTVQSAWYGKAGEEGTVYCAGPV